MLLFNQLVTFIEQEFQVVLAFISVMLMWVNFVYWFKIIDRMTFYFDLIQQTIEDMIWFFIIYILIILACGNMIFILNANRT